MYVYFQHLVFKEITMVLSYMWVNKKSVAWQSGEGNTLGFEVFTALLQVGGS